MTATTPQITDIDAWLRARRRAHHPPTRIGDVLYRLYVAGLLGVPAVWFFNRSIVLDALVLRPEARAVVTGWLPAVLPALLLVGLLAGLRFGTWQGPVVLSHADVRWVLTAPIDRRALLARPLARGIITATGLGLAAGLVSATAAAVLLDAGFVHLLAVTGAGFAAFGAMVAALAWFVECSPRLARAIVRTTPAVLAAAVLLVAAGRAGWHPLLVWWGPPGWAAAAVLDAAGARTAAPLSALTVLCATALALVGAAMRRADAAPFEQLEIRSTFAAGFRASLYFLDLRAAGLARRAASRAITGRRARRLPPPPWPVLAPAWADVLQIVRTRRLWRLLCGVAAFAAAVVWAGRQPGAIAVLGLAGALLGGYVAASAVVEPVWSELEQRFGEQHLRGGLWALIAGHLTTAAVVLSGALLAGLAVAVVVLRAADPLILVAAPLAGPLLVLAAAVPPTGPPPDVSQFLFGEGGSVVVTAQLVRGPLTAFVLAGQPLALSVLEPAWPRLGSAGLWSAVAAAATVVWLRRRTANIA